MDKNRVAEILDELGTLLELKGENPFKCRAYHNASRAISGLTVDIKTLAESGEIRNVKGIGEAIAEKITELVTTEKLKYYDELKSSLPEGLMKMLGIQGVGPKKVKLLYEKLKIKSIEDLEKACKAGKLATLEGFGKKTEENMLAGIEVLRKRSTKSLCSVAELAAQRMFDVVVKQPGVIRAEIAGSLRRKKETIGDIDIVASARRSAVKTVMKSFTSHEDVERVTGEGETKSSVVLKSGINCDLRVVDDAEFPFALNYFTGSKEHNVRMRGRANDYGFSLNEYGFSKLEPGEKSKHAVRAAQEAQMAPKATRGKVKKIVACKTEEDIYRALDLAYVPPELREDTGELEAAEKNTLPALVEEKDINGTFHCHTNYSDGANTILEMAHAAEKLGWHYLGIADHSKIAAYANGLSEERVKKQHKEIDALNQKRSDFRIYKGTEVDILPSGDLDFSDKVLSSFEYVVASVHSSFKMLEAEMTKRVIKALKNKYVTMLGHPTGRLLLQRDNYPIDMIAVINAASDYGKIIEINAHPLRLDLDWRLCSYAKKKNVKIAINPDAHVTDGLTDVHYGVGIARKGWLEKKDVINTLDLKQMDQFLESLRS
ncbi:MAG: DNA polymerase/3'-5' exonuclease PolX [Bacteroidota bacterium]|nr:DNA polymerase/3'-5' exonuclease PolX [Bacteroidota bacterium]